MRGDPVVIDGAVSTVLTSSAGRQFRVMVSVPAVPAPLEGFPVVTVLDADRVFGTMVESIRMRARRPDATGVGPAIVVGVTPVDEGDMRARRTFDFTPAPAVTGPPAEIGGGSATGGAPLLLRFLEDELAPWIADAAPVNPEYRVLFGHSLGGYFVLWSLVNGARFSTYVAASPSIWWSPTTLHAPVARGLSCPPSTHVMVTVGEYEQRRAPWQPVGERTDDALKRREERRMVDHAREFAQALSDELPGAVDFHEFPGEDHASVVVLTVARCLRFALPPAAALAARSLSQVSR